VLSLSILTHVVSVFLQHLKVFHSGGNVTLHSARFCMKMLMTTRTILLRITEVDVADYGLYFCGMSDNCFIFTNATALKVQGNLFNKLSLFLLVVILAVVTAVLLIIILILVLKVRRDLNRLNTGTVEDHKPYNSHLQNCHP
uniref:Uncharacterized protein n=1 Tax=Oncorhynchus kisutch TaxID=8019 RepID=A0A8C7JCK7_ONCKI